MFGRLIFTNLIICRNIEGFYPDSSLDDAVNEFAASARQEFAKTSGFDKLAVYSNVSGRIVFQRFESGLTVLDSMLVEMKAR